MFVALASELDDRPGPARERLARAQREWLELLARCYGTGVAAGQFRRDADPAQFAQDLMGIYLALHHGTRLLHDAGAEPRARRAFETLLDGVRVRKRARRGRKA